MERHLYLVPKTEQTPIRVQVDDLKYDGKNLIIPSYWAETLLEFVSTPANTIAQNDTDDHITLVDFLTKVKDSQNENTK